MREDIECESPLKVLPPDPSRNGSCVRFPGAPPAPGRRLQGAPPVPTVLAHLLGQGHGEPAVGPTLWELTI